METIPFQTVPAETTDEKTGQVTVSVEITAYVDEGPTAYGSRQRRLTHRLTVDSIAGEGVEAQVARATRAVVNLTKLDSDPEPSSGLRINAANRIERTDG